jgi:hypothetical protein
MAFVGQPGSQVINFSALKGRLLLGRRPRMSKRPRQLPAALNCSTTSLLMRPRGETSMP